MIEDTFLLSRALFYVIEDRPLFSLYVLFYVEDGGCMCMCVCVRIRAVGYFSPVSCFFFPLFREGLHRVSRYTSKTTRPLGNSTFFWFLHSFRYYTPRSVLLSIRRSYPFDVLNPPPPPPAARCSSSFNFAHFCFLKHFFVFSSIRWRDS